MGFGFDHVDVQFGVLFAELGDEPGKDEWAEGDKACQPHPAANLIDVAAGDVEDFVEVIQEPAGVAQHLLTRRPSAPNRGRGGG